VAGIIVASSLVTGITFLLEGRGGFVFGTLCGEIAYFFGPLLCAFLWILLASEIIWKRGGHPWALFIGFFHLNHARRLSTASRLHQRLGAIAVEAFPGGKCFGRETAVHGRF
jgi:hypothetical protein